MTITMFRARAYGFFRSLLGNAFRPIYARYALIKRGVKEADEDNIGLVAAGVAFYAFLALVPLLGAVVLTYGLIADPGDLMRNMDTLTIFMPRDAAGFITAQMFEVLQTSDGLKGMGLVSALAVTLFGARNGIGALIGALNVAFEVKEERGFIHLNLLIAGMTAVAGLVISGAILSVSILRQLQNIPPDVAAGPTFWGKVCAYAAFTFGAIIASATLYRFGPARKGAHWRLFTSGSLFTAFCWLLLSIGFGAYTTHIGHYGVTYGSLSAPIVLLTWFYLSVYALLFGAELDSVKA